MKVILISMLLLMPLLQPGVVQQQTNQEQTKQSSSVPIKELLNAPMEVVREDKSLRLTAYAWRDFAPGGFGYPRRLMVALTLSAADKKLLPGGVRLDRAWIIFGEEVWEVSDLRNRIPNQDHAEESWIKCSSRPECQITIYDGPSWDVGVEVIAVVRFTDDEGRHHFLQAPRQKIIATN